MPVLWPQPRYEWSEVLGERSSLSEMLPMTRRQVAKDAYETMLFTTNCAWCWWCGREPEECPVGWYGPWLIERCHIATLPRILDRRMVVLLCSRCHRRQHGQLFAGSLMIDAPELPSMLWLKQQFDPEFYELPLIQRFHVGSLPKSRRPPQSVIETYINRRGGYPSYAAR